MKSHTLVNIRLVFAALLALLLVADRARAQRPILPDLVIPDGFGVNIHFTRAESKELEALGTAGVKWIRMDFAWSGIERKKGEYDFSAYDTLLADMERLGIRCLFILDYGNRLYDNGNAPHTDEGRAAFGRFVSESVRHFAGKPILWEIWNEPNLTQFWKPKHNVDDYCKLAHVTIDAIRQADPGAFIIAPASSGFPWPFFEAMGNAGVFRRLDGVSVHPYRQQEPETAQADYARLRVMLDRFVPERRIPILSGEWGYSTVWSGQNDDKQANYLVRQRLVNLACDVPVSIWYDWRDDGLDPKEPEHHFGTVFRDFSPKPSYIAGKVLSQTLAGYRYIRRIATENPGDYVLLFSRDRQPAFAAWTTGDSHRIVLNLPPGDVRIIARDGTARNATADPAGLAIDLGQSPVYILPAAAAALSPVTRWRPMHAMTALGEQRTTVDVLVENPGPTELTGSFRVILDQFVLARQDMTLAPGQSQVVRIPLNYARRDLDAAAARIVFESAGGNPAIDTAMIQLLPIHPLRVSVLPVVNNQATLIFDNPHATPAQLRVNINTGTSSTVIPLVIEERQAERVLVHKLAAAPPAGVPIIVRAIDADGRLVLAPDPIRWTPLDSPGSADEWRTAVEGDRNVAGSATLSIDKPLDPIPQPGIMAAMTLNYQFGKGWKYTSAHPPKQLRPIVGRPRVVGMWVRGDGSGNTLRCKFTDATDQTHQVTFGEIHWTGWRWITMPIDGRGAHHWGGAKDGVVHYPIRWDALFLIDNQNNRPDRPQTVQVAGFAVGN